MNTYYIAGYPVTDELYHHGIKGQKWGIRRYQNEDGTLTAEGKKRYGSGLGEYAFKKQGIIRKLETGDWALGRKRIGERAEDYYNKKAKKSKEQGRDVESKNYTAKAEAQKQRNIDRELYQSHASTGKIFAQNFLLGVGADSYRVERQNQTTRGQAATAGILATIGDLPSLTGLPAVGAITGLATDAYKSKKRYGHITI